MQNHQSYPLIPSNLVGKPSLVLRRSKNHRKTPFQVTKTPLHPPPSFAQRSPTHPSMQNHQGYPLIPSNLVGKPSLLLRSPKTLKTPGRGHPNVSIFSPFVFPKISDPPVDAKSSGLSIDDVNSRRQTFSPTKK